MRVEAYAKVNLTLRVDAPLPSGMHPIRSLAQTIDWADVLECEPAEHDSFEVTGAVVPDDRTNLVVRALEAVRAAAGRSEPTALRLDKHIPVAAGLGGGSSDAAAALAVAAECLRLDPRERDSLAPAIGSDVPLFLVGGLVRITGPGDRVIRAPEQADYHLAVAVPPHELPTPAVYRCWDDLGGPAGPEILLRHLPPPLRAYGPFVNDLTPAAVHLVPDLGDWISDLTRLWGVPAVMSGSGPSLFGVFPTFDEASGAAGMVRGARAVRACRPTPAGRRRVGDGG